MAQGPFSPVAILDFTSTHGCPNWTRAINYSQVHIGPGGEGQFP